MDLRQFCRLIKTRADIELKFCTRILHHWNIELQLDYCTLVPLDFLIFTFTYNLLELTELWSTGSPDDIRSKKPHWHDLIFLNSNDGFLSKWLLDQPHAIDYERPLCRLPFL